MIANLEQLHSVVERELENVKITDIHTHLFSQDFGDLFLWGIDEVLTYHYLVAEYFRYSSVPPAEFFQLSKKEQADQIWQTLFIDHSPLSEAQRGVLTLLKKLGLDTSSRELDTYRKFFASLNFNEYVDHVFNVAGVKEVVMTNDPFDEVERDIWERTGNNDPRFKAALRVDPLLNDYPKSYKILQSMG